MGPPRWCSSRAGASLAAAVAAARPPGAGGGVGVGGAGVGGAGAGGPAPVEVLPASVPLERLLAAGRPGRDPWFVPIAIGDETLAPVGFELYEGDHALVTGPARSGKTTALLVAAQVVARLYPDVAVYGIAPRRSALRDCPALARLAVTPEEIEALIEECRRGAAHRLVLIDDADAIDDPQRRLLELLSSPVAGLHALIAGRAETFRALGHWSSGARRSRTGLLLQPDLQVDGTLLGATLPRRPAPPARPGSGYRVDPSGFELVQVATATG